MKSRREVITLLGGAAAAMGPLVAHAQERSATRRIGVLLALTEKDSEGQVRVQAFREGLQELGWVEGRNLHIDYRWTGASVEHARSAAAELVVMRPDVIFAGNTTALVALQGVTSTLPIVFAQVADPLARGYVASLARPGGNITGFALYEPGMAAKWVEVLTEVAPHTTRIGVIYGPGNAAQTYLPEIERALPPSVRLAPYAVQSPSELEQAMERIGSEPNSALIVLSGLLTGLHRDLIILLAVKYRLPLVYPYRYFAAAGGFMSYGPDLIEQYRRAASYVDRVLKGEKPADLPVQFPTKYSFVINLKTAKALGLTVPDTLLATANEVIE
jgi:putative ABC transport system substrate-binding protein